MATVNTLEVRITGDTKDLREKLRQATSDVAKWGAASVSAAAAATAAIVKSGLESADALAKQARQLNTTSAALAGAQRAAEMAGVSNEKLGSATRALTVRLAQAAGGAGPAAEALKQLGLSASSLSDMPLPERLATINSRMAELVPAGQRAAMAAALFGEEAGLAMMQIDPATISTAVAQVSQLGGALSEVDAAKIESANDTMSQMGVLTQGISQRLAAQFAPAIDAIAGEFFDAAKDADGFKDEVESAYDIAIKGAAFVIDAVDGIKRVFDIVADGIIAAMNKAAANVADTFAYILSAVSHLPGVDFSDTVASLEAFSAEANAVVGMAMDNISETLNRPMAGDQFKQMIADAEAASQAAAEQAVSERQGAGSAVMAEGGGGESDEAAKMRQQMEERYQVLSESLMSEAELETAHHAEKLAELQAMYEAEFITAEQQWTMMEEMEQQHQDRMTRIEEDAAEARKRVAEAEAAAKYAVMSGMMGNLANLMNTGSKKAFDIGKKAAMAMAAVDGAKAIQAAWAAGMSVGGPWAPAIAAAYAATAAINSANQINNIASQTFGGGGGAPMPAAQGSSGVSAPESAGAGSAASAPSQELKVSGIDSSALFTGDMVRGLAEELLDFQRNGGQVVLV